MTNGEKYLKDNVSVKELIDEFHKFYGGIREGATCRALKEFFEQPTTPTLTEDERVILRNIPVREKYIMRNEKSQLWTGRNPIYRLEQFEHLFQFIKERRRI